MEKSEKKPIEFVETPYEEFLMNKMAIAHNTGFDVDPKEITPTLFPHVKDTVRWAIQGGCRAVFSSFGMQKTVTQLEIERLIIKHKGGKGLIVCPKRVIVEFKKQAKEFLNMTVDYVRNMTEVKASTCDIMVTNYERVRDGKDGVRIEPKYFTVTSLDEASVLRSFGTKTYQQFLPLFSGVPYRFVATATPSPNRLTELVQYAGYLGIMETRQAFTRFFKRDPTKIDNYTLFPGKEREFWIWVATWALFLTKPSDIGYSDEGYELPELRVHEEVVPVDNSTAGYDKSGEKIMFREAALGLQQAAKERRDSLPAKVQRVVEILKRPENINDHFLIWHDLESERKELCKAVNDAFGHKKGDSPIIEAVYGSQDDDEADRIVEDFRDGRLKYLAAKPEMLGEGLNFQYHCHKAIMFVDYRFNDKFQAIARIYRFQQKYPVDVYFVYAESEDEIFKAFMQKWQQHNKTVQHMTEIVHKYGLFGLNARKALTRYMFSKREVENGQYYTAINNDNVLECQKMKDNSVDLIVTSVPFSNLFEYTSAYNDFGFNESSREFFEQMDYLTTELMRILKPGRLMCVHVKDRVLNAYLTGNGFPTVEPFSDECVLHYIRHGFRYMGRITIDTDVVYENNQTYRLGYTEMSKDGSKMGVGMPEYVILFRKQQTDSSNGYGDVPVTKNKKEYSLARWQIDAHADWKSSGNRLLTSDEIKSLGIDRVRHLFREFTKEHIYDYEQHVGFAEWLDKEGVLPKTFMAVDPTSHKDWIWDDIQRTRTLNSNQAKRRLRNHICPLPLDIVERLIRRYSNKGDLVFDPFGGIQTVPYCAVKMGRRGLSTELNYNYWHDGLAYLREAERNRKAPTLFDFDGFNADIVEKQDNPRDEKKII